MLQNAYFLAKIGADTAENEQHFAEILPKIGPQGIKYRSGDPQLHRETYPSALYTGGLRGGGPSVGSDPTSRSSHGERPHAGARRSWAR